MKILFTLLLAVLCGVCCGLKLHQNDHVGTTFYLGVKQNVNGVEQLRHRLLQISDPDHIDYGKWLSRQQIDNFVKSSDQDMTKVKNWLLGVGANHIVTYSDAVKATLPTHLFTTLFTNTNTGGGASYSVPSVLTDCVDVLEIMTSTDSKFKYKLHNRESDKLNSIVVDPGYITREVLMKLYNVPGLALDDHSVSVGAMEYQGGEGFSQSDMCKVQNASSVPENKVSLEHILGINSNDPDGESELDMAVLWMDSASSELWYSDFKGWMYSWALDFFNRENIPQVMSISWGWNERDQCGYGIGRCDNITSQMYVTRTNVEFMKLTSRGKTIVVSSGDAGSPGRTNELCDPTSSHINPVFPGGSPWVLSVGATFVKVFPSMRTNWTTDICIILGCVNGTTEEMTTYEMTGWTSGAGFTNWDTTPDWQKSHVNKYLKSGVILPESKYFNSNGRAYPDISTFGHHCAMFQRNGGGWTGGDGTSCSSPIMAGIIAHLNFNQLSKGKSVLGFVNPLLYKMYEQHPQAFTDISQGNSGCTESTCCQGHDFGFKPQKGMWDTVSGLGSPNVGEMLNFLNK
jgi:tripeptidyl-peptidase-1